MTAHFATRPSDSEILTIRAEVKKIAAKFGMKRPRVRKGSGSQKHCILVSCDRYEGKSVEGRIAVAEYLLSLGLDASSGPGSLQDHEIRLAREYGHTSIELSVTRWTEGTLR